MKTLYYISSICFLFLINCKSQSAEKVISNIKSEKPQNENSDKNSIYYFKTGEKKFLQEHEMNITFNGITEDSRCPKDVQCIWQGVAIADIEIMGTYTRPYKIKLATLEMPNKGYYKNTNLNQWKISLESVNPYPNSKQKTDNKDYIIGLMFEKITN